MMRCDVLMSTSFLDEDSKSTDVSVWSPTALGGKSSYKSGHRHLDHKKTRPATPASSNEAQSDRSGKGSQSSSSSSSSSTKSSSSSNSHSHSHSPDVCDEEHFSNLREKCSDLVWECLQGLISILDAKEFKSLQGT